MINYLHTNYIAPDEYQRMENQIDELIDREVISANYICENTELENTRQEIGRLRKAHDLNAAEQAALFYSDTGACLFLKGDELCCEYFNKAMALYRWMCEESRYLHANYFPQIKEKRKEIEQKIENLSLQKEAWHIISNELTPTYIESIISKLESSGYLCNYPSKVNIVIHLMEYDSNVFNEHIPTLLNTIYLLKENNLLQSADIQRIEKIIERHITRREKEIAGLWFSNAYEALKPLLIDNILETSALLLLSENGSDRKYPENILSARICRYLARFENTYSDLLKNKAYTLLAGECTLNGRICWEDLLSFNLNDFIGKMINIRIEELSSPAETDELKWEQYSNGQNVLTLDRDGFTLSNRFPTSLRSWKGKKDRAALLDNRAFVVSFGKPTYLFDRCKSLEEHYLYWKQFQTEFPLCKLAATVASDSYPEEIEEVTDQPEIQYPAVNDEVTIGIVKNSAKGEYWEGVILDKAYRGMKAVLPYTYFNTCYYRIDGFLQLLSENDSFKAKVIDVNPEGVKVALIQRFNEFVYHEHVQKNQMPAMLADFEDGKLKWLLPTGATTITPHCRWIKPHIGDFYKVEFLYASASSMRPIVKVCQAKANVTEADFFAEIMNSLREFVSFIKDQELPDKVQQQEHESLKQKNNPFATLLNLKEILNSDTPVLANEPAETETTEETEGQVMSSSESMTHATAEELIYCLDLLAKDITDPIEQLDAYCFMQLLCHFAGYGQTAAYYQVCADYIYIIHSLAFKAAGERFSAENMRDFNILQARMEQVGIERYADTLDFFNQVMQLLCSIPDKDKDYLQRLMEGENKVLSECARYISMLIYMTEKDRELQEIIFKHISELLGFKKTDDNHTKKSPVSVYFGHEGIDREFKTSALIHPVKNAGEVQIMALARVIASFMNTDGGTLYIGVSDKGYLSGLEQDLKMCHFDSDYYLRTVNVGIIRQLGECKEDQNRYQDYIRCAFHEYNDGRLVLAFRVPPLNEVVKVNGNVYTRSGSSSIIKPIENVKDFIAQRRDANLNSAPCKPEFPTLFDDAKQEYVFDASAAADNPPVVLPVIKEAPKKQPSAASAKKKKALIDIQTSALRPNPLQKKAEMGYTSTYQFVSFYLSGKIACSPSPKIGVWGESDGKVIFSYDTEGAEDLLISVLKNGMVGISNLKRGFSQPNTLFTFLTSPQDLLFAAPATKSDYLLLVAERRNEKRYRVISLADFDKSMNIQPKLTTTLVPDKGSYIYAEILHPEQIEELGEEKLSIDSFDAFNAGRLWEQEDNKNDVEAIVRMCNIRF